MRYQSTYSFLARARHDLTRGPVAMIFAEDDQALDTTLRHHQNLGFRTLILFDGHGVTLADDLAACVHHVTLDLRPDGAVADTVTTLAQAAPETWMYYGYNAEFLYFPFCETRSVSEILGFHAEERRDAMLTYVIDLYAGDLDQTPNAVSLDDAWFDTVGYYAQTREDPDNGWLPKERQLDFYGGLRWRFEEHVPWERRKIDRIALFRAQKSLRLRPDHTFNLEEYNTYACEWHNNLTAAVMSFRTAKALKKNPGSTYDIRNFRWHKSAAFEWNSRQLMNLGLMEPGQWF